MKNKLLISVCSLVLLIGMYSCYKKCESSISTCKDTPSSNEICLAYFKSWFYNKTQNKCEQIGYSGCAPKGFATKQECEECICNK